MISSARMGDMHLCPLPGHGTTPVASSSTDVSINGMGSARVGDVCGCGAVITTGFPSILVNGRPMAHLGSPTSHGGTIITGSADTFGGFTFGSGATGPIVNFAKLGAIHPDGTVDEERMACLLADPDLTGKATAADALVTQDQGSAENSKVVCTHPDQMEALASYIADEMNRNIKDPVVLRMKELNSYDADAEREKFNQLPWYARLSPPDFVGLANSKRLAAFALWTERVGQNRPWDHKPKIFAKFGNVWHKQGQHDYFYDIWSNIHYGYVGMAGGLSESLLLDGAGLEQIVSDSFRKLEKWEKNPGPHRSEDIPGLRAWDDIPDRKAITIGIDLYRKLPAGEITASVIMGEVLAIGSKWGRGRREHSCK